MRNDRFDLQRGVVVNSRWSSTNTEVYRDTPFVHHCWGTFWASSIVEHGTKRGPTTDKDSFEIFWNKNEYLSYAKEVQSILKLQIYEKLWEVGRLCPRLFVQMFSPKKCWWLNRIREENGACTLERFRETEALMTWYYAFPIFWVQMLIPPKNCQCSECMDPT